MSRPLQICWLIVAVFVVESFVDLQTCSAATVTFVTPERDAALLAALPDRNFGGFDAFQSGLSVSAPTRSIVSFDVSSLAGQYEAIDSITLRLFFQSFDSTAVKTPGIYAVTNANANWVEGTANNAVQAGSSSWDHQQSPTLPWAGSAGLSTSGASVTTPGADYASTLLSSLTFSNLGTSPPVANTPFDFNFTGTPTELTALIDNWIDVANAGLIMRDVNEGSLTGSFNRILFQSREDAPEVHPMLIVSFTAPIPEPSSLTLGLLGLCGLMFKKRQRTSKA